MEENRLKREAAAVKKLAKEEGLKQLKAEYEVAFGRAPCGIKCNDTGWLAEQIESIGGEAMVAQTAVATELAAAQAVVAKAVAAKVEAAKRLKKREQNEEEKRLKRGTTAATKEMPRLGGATEEEMVAAAIERSLADTAAPATRPRPVAIVQARQA